MLLLGDWTDDTKQLHQSSVISKKVIENIGDSITDYNKGAATSNLGFATYRIGEIEGNSTLIKDGIKLLEKAISLLFRISPFSDHPVYGYLC